MKNSRLAVAAIAQRFSANLSIRRNIAAWLLTAIAVFFTAGTTQSVATTQEALPAGTYIIPMDNQLQGGGTFNTRAYGLATRLLHAGVPLKWIINPNKTSNGAADFVAAASRISPSAQGSANRQFIAGPLAIHPGFESQALAVINSWGASNNVAVFRLTNAATVPVYATLLHRPKVAVFNQGGKSGIHTNILSRAGLASGTHYQVVNNAASIGAGSCFTAATEPHSKNISSQAATSLTAFLRSGGNFFGQCAAIRGYTSRGILSTGNAELSISGSIRFDNFRDPMAQFQGGLTNQGGSVKAFSLTSNPGLRIAYDSSSGSRYKAYVGRVTGVNRPVGGWVHYLAGHSYGGKSGGTSNTNDINGRRMLLNAVLRPADRPDECGLTLGTDYRITKTVNNSTPEVGQNVTFTINAINSGPTSAANVVVNDLLPNGLTYVSHTTSGGTYVPATGVWTIGTLANGAQRTLTLTATATAASIPSRTNTATITSTTPDSNPNNNTASATVTPRYADMRVVKTVNDSTPTVGQNITFTLTATNLGPNNATGVTVNDLLPAGLSHVSHVASIGLYNPGTGVWSIGGLNAGASQTLDITANVTLAAMPSVINSAQVTANQFDPVPSNNFSSVTVFPRVSDLAVVKTVDNGNEQVGGTVTFTIVATNNGPADNANVIVNDPLPTGLSYQSHTASIGAYNPATGLWTIGSFTNGASATLTITAGVTASALPAAVNTAVISGEVFDPNLNNNTSSATVSPGLVADLAITKSVDNSTPLLGGPATFTLTASNNGPFDATGVIVQDLLPSGLDYVSHVASTGTYNPVTGLWDIGNLANTASATLTILVNIGSDAIPSATNVATITGNEFDPDITNNIDDETVEPDVAADIEVVKTVDVTPVVVGEDVVFTIVVTNNGPTDATQVLLNDLIPLGLEYLAHTTTIGSYNPASGNWAIGNLANGDNETLTITAMTNLEGGSVVDNVANVTAREKDPVPENNSSTASVTILSGADLAIVKTVNEEQPLVGETVIFTLTITNNGPENATGAVITDILPDGFVNPSNISDGGELSGNTITWPPIDIAVGDTVIFTLEATVAPANP